MPLEHAIARNTICLWFNGGALDAARFYADTFPDSHVGAVQRAPGDFPDGHQGDRSPWHSPCSASRAWA